MSNMVAKRYVKAILSCISSDDEFREVDSVLKTLASAFLIPKLDLILNYPSMTQDKKIDFLLSLIDNKNNKIKNLLKILNDNKKLSLIPAIYEEFSYQKSLKDNVYQGTVYSNFKIQLDKIKQLETSFSKKFNSSIIFNENYNSYNGIKIELDKLGFEVSFSLDRLKTQMSEYIIKAI